jgi:hypothetical protein
MVNLKVHIYGTQYFIDTYATGLRSDCEKFGYDLTVGVVPDAESFSHINHHIHREMVRVVRNAGPEDRILFLDPECRIVRPIPQDWIEDTRPILCYKIADDKHDINRYEYGHTLPGAIQMQPIFLTSRDWDWIQWWYDASMAASDTERKVYVPHELFLELAVKFNKIDSHVEHCVYNRDWQRPQRVVKGSFMTEDTIITHPDIHALLDPNVKHSVGKLKASPFLITRKLHNHFNDLSTIKRIDELMFKEMQDINRWPAGTTEQGEWLAVEDWLFDPRTGRLKHRDYDTIKYHTSLLQKIERDIKTPAVKNFKSSNRS